VVLGRGSIMVLVLVVSVHQGHSIWETIALLPVQLWTARGGVMGKSSKNERGDGHFHGDRRQPLVSAHMSVHAIQY